jgi:hypothetical protein
MGRIKLAWLGFAVREICGDFEHSKVEAPASHLPARPVRILEPRGRTILVLNCIS